MQTSITIVFLISVIGVFYSFWKENKEEDKDVLYYKAVVSKDGVQDELETFDEKLIHNWITDKEKDGSSLIKYEVIII